MNHYEKFKEALAKADEHIERFLEKLERVEKIIKTFD